MEPRTALVTGANTGIGFQVARALAKTGMSVILACRNSSRAAAAMERIRLEQPASALRALDLDLADLESVRRAAATLLERGEPLDLLINSAGVMGLRKRGTTRQGFELQFGTNHLGPFALTGQILPLLLARPGARIVTVSALRARGGKVDFDDLDGKRHYSPFVAYSQSKLANLLFALELDRRLRRKNLPVSSLAAHPGLAATNLFLNGPGLGAPWILRVLLRVVNRIIAQPAVDGASPVLHAALSPDAVSGGYYGPGGFLELRGRLAEAKLPEHARDPALAARLWQVSEELTKVSYREIGTARDAPP